MTLKQIILTCLVCIALTGGAIAGDISIISRSDAPPVKITIKSKYDFERGISLKIRTDPALIPSDELIAVVGALDLFDANGVAITSGYDIDPKHDLVIGFSGGSADIIKAHKTAKGVQIVASFKDTAGNFVVPPVSNLAVYDIGGKKLCFDYEDVEIAAPPMLFALLLDRSGSMETVIGDVTRTARRFLGLLPDSAQCMVGSFSDDYTDHGYGQLQPCQSRYFDLRGIMALGGTDLYTPLLDMYRFMGQPQFKNHQKAVIIVTDGVISDTPEEAERRKYVLLQEKQDTLTFTFWLGEHSDQHLAELADGFMAQGSNIRSTLAGYFDAIGNAYRKQRVLNITSCPKSGGHHVSP